MAICTLQPSSFHEQVDFMLTPKGIEVSGNQHGFWRGDNEIVQHVKLLLTMPVFERQMHQKNRALFQFEFDRQPFNALVEIMKTLAVNSWRRQKGVALFAHDRQKLIQRGLAVFALINGVMAERPTDGLCLVDPLASNGPRVDLDEPYDVRILTFDEFGDALEI